MKVGSIWNLNTQGVMYVNSHPGGDYPYLGIVIQVEGVRIRFQDLHSNAIQFRFRHQEDILQNYDMVRDQKIIRLPMVRAGRFLFEVVKDNLLERIN